MIQSVWDKMNTASKYVMISTWLHTWRDEQKPSLCLRNDPDHAVVSLVSSERINDLITTASRKWCKLGKHQMYILKDYPLASQSTTHNQYNKYLQAAWASWQGGEWCGWKKVDWMDGTDRLVWDQKAKLSLRLAQLISN